MIIPVWVCSAGLYIILCYLFGVNKGDSESADEAVSESVTVEDEQEIPVPVRKKATGWGYIAGFVAMCSLAVCLGMAVWVAGSGSEDYNGRLEFFKNTTIYLTVIYFVFGIVWMVQQEKGRTDGN